MATPDPRHSRRSEAEPYIEEATFYSHDTERTYHVRRVDVGGGWSYQVSMEVVAKGAAEDILGMPDGSLSFRNTRDIWNDIWNTQRGAA